MRRLLIPVVCLVAACTAEPEAEPEPTNSTIPVVTTSTSAETTLPETTSTSAPAEAATTSAPATTSTLALDETILAYQLVAELNFPVQLTARAGQAHSYVITKDGRVRLYDGSAIAEAPVLDILERVRNDGEQGLLSMALHPTDPARFYLHYSDTSGDTVVSEFTFSTPEQADPASERVLLEVDQPAGNHNGGMIQFAPDGSLILGLGDGGGAGDGFQNGQNPDTLLGGLVSIDVEGADPNPTKYAMGLRNPWRFWIDGKTIYIADVGQNTYEEVSVVPLQPDHNFGWPILEGMSCFTSSDCDGTGMVMPVLEVEHGDAGTCSITGGPVYGGASLPLLIGHYFYSDYCGGYLRSFLFAAGATSELRDWTDQVGVPGQVTGFGVDGAGEVYVTTINQLLKVVAGG